MLKRYFISYKFSSVNGHEVVYAFNKEDAIKEFYKVCKYCTTEDNPEFEISEKDIKDVLYGLDKSELITIIEKLL